MVLRYNVMSLSLLFFSIAHFAAIFPWICVSKRSANRAGFARDSSENRGERAGKIFVVARVNGVCRFVGRDGQQFERCRWIGDIVCEAAAFVDRSQE